MTNAASSDDTIHISLNRSNPNSLPDMLRIIALGDVLAAALQARRKVDMDAAGANAGNLATLDALVLPDDGKAASIVSAYARVGGVTGSLTVVAPGTTPATTQIAVAPNGNIVTLAADAITNLDIEYHGVPDVEVIESVFPVSSNAIALPAQITDKGAVLLAEAEVLEGTGTGNKIVLAAGGSPAAGQAALNTAKSSVVFAGADAATRARVKLLVAKAPAKQLSVALTGAAVTG